MVSAKFTELYEETGKIKSGPTQEEQLDLYAYAKIAKKAELGQRPGMMNFVGKAKWDIFDKYLKEGLTPEEAEEKYIVLAEKLVAAHK